MLYYIFSFGFLGARTPLTITRVKKTKQKTHPKGRIQKKKLTEFSVKLRTPSTHHLALKKPRFVILQVI